MHINDGLDQVAKAFQSRYPEIKVDFTLENVATFAPKIVTEQRNGQFLWDVLIAPSSTATNVLTPANALQDFLPLVLPEAKDSSKWHGGFEMWGNNKTNIKTVFITATHLWGGLMINRDVIPKSELAGIDQLLDPKWRGKMVIDEPHTFRQGSIALSPFYREKGAEFIKKLLTDQQPVYTTNPRLNIEWYATGRYPITFGDRPDIIEQFKSLGIIKASDWLPPYYLAAWGLAVFAKAPHSNAAKVFINWFLSKEGQDVYVRGLGKNFGVSRRTDVESQDPEHTPKWSELSDYVSPTQEKDAQLVRDVIEIYRSTKK
jgi:iron(III) transport system substrate-binding protein